MQTEATKSRFEIQETTAYDVTVISVVQVGSAYVVYQVVVLADGEFIVTVSKGIDMGGILKEVLDRIEVIRKYRT